MEPSQDSPAEERFDLCIGDGSVRFKLADERLTLSDEGISYALDGRSGLRPFSDLRGVRLQALHGGRNRPWEALLELRFIRGRPLVVHSSAAWGGDDPRRDAAFVAFVEALHRRIPPEDAARIAFRRGVPEHRHKVGVIAFAIGIVIFGGAGLFMLFGMLGGKIPFLPALGSLAGIVAFGLWMNSLVQKNRPGTYEPSRLPRELYPERN